MPDLDDIRGQLRGEHQHHLAELEALHHEGDAHRCKSRLAGLRHAWAVHALAEEAVVYRSLEDAQTERFIEHELIESLFDKLARGRPGTLEWHARLHVAHDLAARHIEQEEQELFATLAARHDAEALRRMQSDFTRERDRLERLERTKAA